MGRLTTQDLATTWVAMRVRQGKSKSTVRQSKTASFQLATWWDNQRKSPRGLDIASIEEYLYGPGGVTERLQPSSFNTRLQLIGLFLKWMIARGYVHAELLDALQPLATEKKEYTRLGLAKLVDMIETTEDEWERWVMVLASQLLGRDGELRALKLGDFDFDNNVVNYYRPKTSDRDQIKITPILKEGYWRWVMWLQDRLGTEAEKTWYAIPRRNPVAVPGGWGWSYSPELIRGYQLAPVVKEHVSRVLRLDQDSLKGQGVHLIRRSMARAFYDQLVEMNEPDPVRPVMTALGHKSPLTTERYLGLRPDRERRNKLLATGELLWTRRGADVASVIRLEGPSGRARSM